MALLEVKGIKKRFGKSEILKGIDFDLEKGEVLSIIGSSGSGKTTLLRCINFLEFAENGTITVNGEQIYNGETDNKIKEKDLRQKRLHFGLVFQDFNLFPQYNVLQNLTLAPSLLKMGTKEELEAQARQIIKKVGLEEKVDFYPCQLSGGQKQRVAIARALMLNPDILCFDEPTSALDPELTGEVLRVIKSLKDTGSTMIVVTHEMEFARNVSDKVMFMADGVVEEMGDPAQIFDNPQSEKHALFLQIRSKSYNISVKDIIYRYRYNKLFLVRSFKGVFMNYDSSSHTGRTTKLKLPSAQTMILTSRLMRTKTI